MKKRQIVKEDSKSVNQKCRELEVAIANNEEASISKEE